VSGQGTETEPFSFPTYQHQIKGELLEYGRILYKSLHHELEQEDLDWDKIFLIKERQVRFELDLTQTGQFGEIRNMLAEGLRARRVDELKEQTTALLSLRESMASVRENRRLAMTGMVLAYVLGLLGLPGVVDFLNTNIAPHIDSLAALDEKSLVRIGVLAVCTLAVLIGLPLGFLPIFKRMRWISRSSRIRRH
jgi:hypothetical protein